MVEKVAAVRLIARSLEGDMVRCCAKRLRLTPWRANSRRIVSEALTVLKTRSRMSPMAHSAAERSRACVSRSPSAFSRSTNSTVRELGPH
ncbi:hypothetical protein D3C78_1577180 [compost metagenome]